MKRTLSYRTVCSACGGRLRPGDVAHRFQKKYRCLSCGDWPTDGFTVTRLPDAVAEGAEDSSKSTMHASHGVSNQQGQGRREAIPVSRFDAPPGKRRRLPMQLRRARQRNND